MATQNATKSLQSHQFYVTSASTQEESADYPAPLPTVPQDGNEDGEYCSSYRSHLLCLASLLIYFHFTEFFASQDSEDVDEAGSSQASQDVDEAGSSQGLGEMQAALELLVLPPSTMSFADGVPEARRSQPVVHTPIVVNSTVRASPPSPLHEPGKFDCHHYKTRVQYVQFCTHSHVSFSRRFIGSW